MMSRIFIHVSVGKIFKNFINFESLIIFGLLSNDVVNGAHLLIRVITPYIIDGKLMNLFFAMFLGIIFQIVSYSFYLKKTRKLTYIFVSTLVVLLFNTILLGSLDLLMTQQPDFTISYSSALFLCFWYLFSTTALFINASFILCFRMPQTYLRQIVAIIILLTMVILGALDAIIETQVPSTSSLRSIFVIFYIILISFVIISFWIKMIKNKQDFSIYLPKNTASANIENPIRNPKRNFVMIFVVFFAFFGSGMVYSLILNNLSIQQESQLFRAFGTILSGIIIIILISTSKPNTNYNLIIYSIIISAISLCLFYFDVAMQFSIVIQVSGYYAIICFLFLAIDETNIPRKYPEYNVYIWGWALAGYYLSISLSNYLLIDLNVATDYLKILAIFILFIAFVLILIQFYESKLFDQSEVLSITIENISDGVININKSNRVQYVNSAACVILNMNKETLIGKEFCDIYNTIKKEGCDDSDPLLIVKRERIPLMIELDHCVISKKSQPCTLEQTFFPLIDEMDEFTGVIWVIKDVTKKVKKEKEFYQKQRLDSLGKLAGMISHHFNNILAEIMGNSELLLDELKESGGEAKELTSNIIKSVQRAKNIGFQLLTFSKSGAPVKRWVNINEIVIETASLIFSGTNIIANFSFDQQFDDLFVDPEQITQVLQNVFINSKEAIENSGIVNIEIFSLDEDGKKYKVIAIKDSGKGIEEKDLPMVFDPYYTTKPEATGLGLTVAYNIMKNHGGKITIQSKLGEFTLVSLFIPIPDEIKTSTVRKTSANEIIVEGAGDFVLILDDEPMILNILKKILEKLNFTPILASTGAQAIELLKELRTKKQTVKFAILDINVPGEYNGIETLAKLREIDSNLLAIASSGYTNNDLLSNPSNYGFNAMLPKPYTSKDLRCAIGQILELKRKI